MDVIEGAGMDAFRMGCMIRGTGMDASRLSRTWTSFGALMLVHGAHGKIV